MCENVDGEFGLEEEVASEELQEFAEAGEVESAMTATVDCRGSLVNLEDYSGGD